MQSPIFPNLENNEQKRLENLYNQSEEEFWIYKTSVQIWFRP